MRLFVAIALDRAVTENLAKLCGRLGRPGDGLRWSAAESWHITLQFLGSATESQYTCVFDRLRILTAAPIPIQMGGLGFFDRAGVFFVEVMVTPQLAQLQQRVIAATASCGFVPEDRPYHPHVTLARNKGKSDGIRNLKPRTDGSIDRFPSFPSFAAREFLIYESFPGPSGSRYEIRARFPLAGLS